MQPVQALVAAALIEVDMALAVEGDGLATRPVRPRPQGSLLRDDALDREHRGGLAEQPGHLRLEGADRLALAVKILRQVGQARLRQCGKPLVDALPAMA